MFSFTSETISRVFVSGRLTMPLQYRGAESIRAREHVVRESFEALLRKTLVCCFSNQESSRKNLSALAKLNIPSADSIPLLQSCNSCRRLRIVLCEDT